MSLSSLIPPANVPSSHRLNSSYKLSQAKAPRLVSLALDSFPFKGVKSFKTSYPLSTKILGMSDFLDISAEGREALEIQSIDGTKNNLIFPKLGNAGKNLSRIASSQYEDDIKTPAGADRPSPRVISNAIADQREPIPDERGLSSMVWLWGQFMAHDTDLTPHKKGVEPFEISIPKGDRFFDPMSTGEKTMGLHRSQFDPSTGERFSHPREQVNVITEWVDGSMVYGSDPERAAWLRTGEGGKLKVSEGELLPFNDGTQKNAPPSKGTEFFLAGDVRANEHTGLIAIHTLFTREHNYLADQIKEKNPDLTDEQIYQKARKIVIAEIQNITYEEFLPALLGEDALEPYQGYSPFVDPSVSNEFATALFRYGHSTVPEKALRIEDNGEVSPEGNLSLRDAFWMPQRIIKEGGIDPILRGMAVQVMDKLDTKFVDGLRNFMFGAPGAGGLDLVSLNIQRGRDHGLADYNTIRQAYGLNPVRSFDEITSDPELAKELEALYGDVNNIDLWLGALAEDHLPGTSVGELVFVSMKDQFERLRDGDRFWFENNPSFSDEELDEIKNTTLADIMRRNTENSNVHDNVFFAK